MSLDVYLVATRPTEVFSANITHNLGEMAAAAGIYQHLWRPEELNISRAGDLIVPLTEGLGNLKARSQHFSKYDAPNGWGRYDNLVAFVESYLAACKESPDAEIQTSR